MTWLDDFVWGIPMIVLLLGTHLFMTLRTGFIQRKTLTGIKLSVTKDPDSPGDVSQFQALTTALASTIGTGNIIGVGTAIFLGGPGAVFWCWIAGVFGIATKYAESFIAVKYRVRTPDGKMQGGAMYALERGLNMKWLGVLFAAARAYKSPWTMKRLLKTPQTWLIGIGMGLLWMVTVAIVSQLVSRLMGAGYERTAAVGMLSVMGFFGIFGSYIWGFIDLKIGTRKATYIYAAWYAVALLLLIFMANTVTIYLGVFMVGISVGGICNLIPSMIGSVFGRYDFAAASRFISAVTKGICACAYLYNAQSLKLTGSLTAGYVGLIVLCGVAALLVFLIKPVVKPQN